MSYRLKLVVFVAIVLAAIGAVVYRLRTQSEPPRPVWEWELPADIEPVTRENPGFVGVAVCAECHAERVAHYQKSRHAHACKPVTPGEMPNGFTPPRHVLGTRDPNLRFEMFRRGDEFFQAVIRKDPKGERRWEARLDLAYGSGGHGDEIYFTWDQDRLFELSIAWMHQHDRWGSAPPPPDAEGIGARTTQPRCLECHCTWVEPIPGTENQYRRETMILGVGCERCHGPARDHVAYHREHPNSRPGHAIVKPEQLDREQREALCAQCHSSRPRYAAAPFTYRPGQSLDAHYRLTISRHPEEDHVANQDKYLRQSKCFQKSTMTCITCHDPHGPSNPVTLARSCQQCHQPADCKDRPHQPEAVRNNCVGCHMPERVWMNVHFHTEDDDYLPAVKRSEHRIAVHPEARSTVLLNWLRGQADEESRRQAQRLTQELTEFWHGEAERRLKDHRHLAAIGALREALRIDPSEATRKRIREVSAESLHLRDLLTRAQAHVAKNEFPQAVQLLQQALKINPDHAGAHADLGSVYAATGDESRAQAHWKEVARCDPNDARGLLHLGIMAFRRQRTAEAVEHLLAAEQIEPYSEQVNYHLGLALAASGKLDEAIQRFREALEINPRHAGACQGLAVVLRRQNEAEESVRWALRAARLTKAENADIMLTLADSYAAAGRQADAEAAAARALELAQASNDVRYMAIARRRLDELKKSKDNG